MLRGAWQIVSVLLVAVAVALVAISCTAVKFFCDYVYFLCGPTPLCTETLLGVFSTASPTKLGFTLVIRLLCSDL